MNYVNKLNLLVFMFFFKNRKKCLGVLRRVHIGSPSKTLLTFFRGRDVGRNGR